MYYKLKLDSIKAMLDENTDSLSSYFDMKKVKANERKTQGVSIVVNNNYHIARPWDNIKDISRETIEGEVIDDWISSHWEQL